MFDQIANELKTAREKNSMSLVQVANKSKIDIKFLEAMEQGDFAFLPELYVRAFIKNFARTVGLDENKILKKFEAAKKGIPYVEEEPVFREIIRNAKDEFKQETNQNKPKEKPKSRKTKLETASTKTPLTFNAVGGSNPPPDPDVTIKRRNIIIGSSLIGAIVLLAAIYFLFIDKGEQFIVVEKPIEEVIRQNQRYVEEDQTKEQNDLNIGISDSLLLTINASDTSWIKVSIDGLSTDEFILLPNSQKTLKAKNNYNITFGNSGAINLQLNKKPLPFAGKSKSVISALIDREGVKYSDKSSPQR